MINLFKILSDETRLRILRLCDGMELNVHELTKILEMAQPRISNHLKLLRQEGLLDYRREGTWAYYRMPDPEELPERARRLWPESKAWMESEGFQAGDLQRREEILASRNEPAGKYFEAIGAGWDDIGVRIVDEAMRDRLLLALVPEGLTVADVGTGAGSFLGTLSPFAERVIGIDPSPAMLKAAAERVAEAGWDNVDLREGSLESLPLKDEEADAVFCNLVLHHSPKPEEAVAEMVRSLKKGGRLTICDFATHGLDWMRQEMADFWLGFEPEALRGWMENAGLRSIRVATLGEAVIKPENGRRRAATLTVLSATALK